MLLSTEHNILYVFTMMPPQTRNLTGYLTTSKLFRKTQLPFIMGASHSSSPSYLQYKNDFELVIRATKDLEHLLETRFGAPSTKQTGLHDKITHAERGFNLSKETVKKMRYLVTCECSLQLLACMRGFVYVRRIIDGLIHSHCVVHTVLFSLVLHSTKQDSTRARIQFITRSGSIRQVL